MLEFYLNISEATSIFRSFGYGSCNARNASISSKDILTQGRVHICSGSIKFDVVSSEPVNNVERLFSS